MKQTEVLQDISGQGEHTIAYWEPTWVHNAVLNREVIFEGLKTGKVKSITLSPKAFNKPAFVFGSGATLNSVDWDLVRDVRDTIAIFATSSNMNVLLAHDITPDYVVIVDSSPSVGWWHLKPHAKFTKDITLLAPPTVDPEVFKIWRGPIYIFRPVQNGNIFTEKILPTLYSHRININETTRHYDPVLEVGLLNAGSVVNSAVLCAAFLSYDPVCLVGVDLGFPRPKGRSDMYDYRRGKWIKREDHPILAPREILQRSTNGIKTTIEMLHYKLNLFVVWKMTPCHLVNIQPDPENNESILTIDEIPIVNLPYALGHWQDIVNDYPMDVGSPAFQEHILNIVGRMGLRPPGSSKDDKVTGDKQWQKMASAYQAHKEGSV